MIFGVSIPIPLCDRNQGNTPAAGYKLEKARAESREAAIKANSALGDAHQALLSSYKEATGLRDNVLPGLERLLDAHYQRSLKDRSALSEVVDVRQALRDARVRYIEALAAYHTSAGIITLFPLSMYSTSIMIFPSLGECVNASQEAWNVLTR